MQPANTSQAYKSSQKLRATARQTESRALLEAARLMDASMNGDDIDAYRAALRLNWRLWTIIQADVSSEESVLPDDVRSNLLSLSVFIDKHTVGALAEPEGRKMRVLIDINRNIARGLMEGAGELETGEQAASAPAPTAAAPDNDVVA
jgi:flagellar protein FlaF